MLVTKLTESSEFPSCEGVQSLKVIRFSFNTSHLLLQCLTRPASDPPAPFLPCRPVSRAGCREPRGPLRAAPPGRGRGRPPGGAAGPGRCRRAAGGLRGLRRPLGAACPRCPVIKAPQL